MHSPQILSKPELRLALHITSLQAYNSVTLVSLLACLSQLVYSLDVWPSADWDTHKHTQSLALKYTLAGDQVRPLCGEQRQNVLDQVGRIQP